MNEEQLHLVGLAIFLVLAATLVVGILVQVAEIVQTVGDGLLL